MRRMFIAMAVTASLLTTAPSHLLDPLWALFSRIWSSSTPLQPQPDAGCGADPNGRCLPDPQPQPNAGCESDPSGRCNPSS